ncbi:ABC transporter ATP-binding protein [Brevibacillus massiliensis]|jgi:energy-coupling factor transport system ATP-binding protein|uniref:ABC transporter ATP-binding protein n=1 Tax=Brevibacillus massiliensis TaxID=1118054 RepID=UPI0002FEE5E3|nr:ABC transporter ATP-binding protein [Brevibacillus massiliensis]
MIGVRDLTFRFAEGEAPVLHGVNLDIQPGDVLLLLGPSGSGKSTLALCLNGLYPEAVDGVLAGSITLSGRSLSEYRLGEVCREIGVVFQDPESQFCMISVEEEIVFGLENLGMPPEAIEKVAGETLDLFGLTPYRRAPIHSLSGGMKQKLALACVIAMKPRILILDEPTASLDPHSAREFVRLVKRLHHEEKLTVIIIEHRLDEWMDAANRCALLDRSGSLVFEGDPRSAFAFLQERPDAEGVCLPEAYKLGREWMARGIYRGSLPPITEGELVSGVGHPAMAEALLDQQEADWRAEHKRSRGGMKPAGPPLLAAERLAYARGGVQVLESVDLCLYSGEWVMLAGRNGAGKTTLAGLLANVLPLQKGRICFAGKELESWNESALRRRIGYVFQNPEHQFVTDSVYEEIAFSLRLLQWTPEQIDHRVAELLECCRLTGVAKAHPFALSFGQKRRLSIAAMLANHQDLLILDEPTAGQDAHSTEMLMSLLQEVTGQGGSVCMITHDMNLADRYADRIVLLDEGRIAFDGPPNELWSRQDEPWKAAQLLPPFRWSLRKQFQAAADAGSRRECHAAAGD